MGGRGGRKTIRIMCNVNESSSKCIKNGYNVYHYTNLSNINSILTKEGIKLWATRYGYFDDKSEYVWAKKHIFRHLRKTSNMTEEEFDYEYENITHPYVVSLTFLEDNLNMWRLYGNNGEGISLVFDIDRIEEYCKSETEKILRNVNGQDMSCLSTSYTNEEKLKQAIYNTYKLYARAKGNLIDDLNNLDDLSEVVAFIKKDDYEIEDEYRICRFSHHGFTCSPKDGDCVIKDYNEMIDDVKLRVRGKQLIPYVEIVLPKDTLKGIYIGYECDFEKTKTALELFLQNVGYSIEIKKSLINE